MGKMQERLKQLLHHVGKVTNSSLRYPSAHEVTGSSYANEVERVYRDLGGILPTFPLQLRNWDIEFEGIAVELDEYLHSAGTGTRRWNHQPTKTWEHSR